MKLVDTIKLEKAQNDKIIFKIEDFLREAVSIYSKNWIQFSLYTLTAMLLLVISSVTVVGPYIIYFPLVMGFCNVAEKIENEEDFKFKDFFVGFNKWTRFLGLTVLIMVVSIGILLPYFFTILNLESLGLMDTSVGLYSLVFLPIYIALMFVFITGIFMAPYILYFNDKISFSEGLRLSYLIAKKNFLPLLIFILLISVIFQFGFYFCFVGAFVTIPLSYIMAYLFVKDLLLKSDRELDLV